MVRRSARLAAKRAPQPPGPDRLSALPQELFLRICDYLMNYESDSLLKMSGRKLQFSHAKDLRALHITSKLLLEKTSTSICKLGFPMTESGLKPLLRMAGYPHVAHNIIHVKLLSPTEMSFYWHQTKNNCKRLTDILTECFVRLINLRKIELSGIKTQFRPNASPLNDSSKHFSWSAGSALSAIHATRICVTDLIYDEAAAGTMAPSPPNPFPPTWLSAFENIEKFRTVEHDSGGFAYTERILRAMPKLKELTITPMAPKLQRQGDGRNYFKPASGGWVRTVLYFSYNWRLTSFHASNFTVKSVGVLGNFLHTHSPTLRDLSLSEVMVLDSERTLLGCQIIAKRIWTEIFQIILDEMNLTRGKFHDLLYWRHGHPGKRLFVAMSWDQSNGLELDVYGRKFEDIARLRGVMRALADWKDGMVMVVVS
ncbi:hypothetical protein BFW01_g1552 [Lasiodiplodia theobromae]|nr:hypothetical protein BFW01_g1552 [Lasiodiplodia theobromae]